ncbi:hypothetical protein [Bacillus cereus]|uniref:hypothetical protein n=1 Tax=Bacillus cereus TaxID=1396 RepID=UPI00019FE30A|nr:hypothetical protein [Bacillus cereus]EEK53340.1 hypothetical protein bcere0004_53360 [Bacillus cereus BGSC 6E1]
MYFIICEDNLLEKSKVTFIHYDPDQLSEEEKRLGFLIEELPEKEIQQLKKPILYFNQKTKYLWYEYVDRELTTTEEFSVLSERVNAVEDSIIRLMDLQTR